MTSRLNSDQAEYRGNLNSITPQVSTELGFDSLLPSIDSALTPPLRMRASSPISKVVNIDNLTITNPQHGRKTTIAPIGGTALPVVTTFTVTMDTTGAGNATPSSGSVIALGMSASQFLKVGVAMNAAGALVLTKGTTSSTLAGAGVPSAPSGAYPIGYFFVATDGSNNVSNLDETNIVQYVGAGSGSSSASSSGGVTYFYDTFETETVGALPSTWARYADAAGVTPVDGTGGSPNASFTFLTSATSPLDGSNSAILSKPAANVQGNGLSRDFTIQNGYSTGRKNTYSFLINTTDANYVAGYLVAYIYDITNGVLITPSTTAIPQNFNGLWTLTWDSVSTSQSYRVIFHCATTTTTAWTVKIDDVLASPGTITQGAAISEWQSYTPVITGTTTNPTRGTNTEVALWRRVGSNMEISYTYNQTAAGSAGSGTYLWSIPTGYTIDATRITSSRTIFGPLHAQGGSTEYTGYVSLSGTSSLLVMGLFTAIGTSANLNSANTFFGSTSAQLQFVVSIPINEFAGGTVNLGPGASVEYLSYYDSGDTQIAFGTTYSTAANVSRNQLGSKFNSINSTNTNGNTTSFQMTWATPRQAGDKVWLEVFNASTGWTEIGSNGGPVYSIVQQIVTAASNEKIYGMGYYSNVGTTSATVFFGNSGRTTSGVGFGALGSTFASIANSVSFAWRLCKANPSSPVGFGMAGTDGSSGLVQAGKVPGLTTGAAIASGYVGEFVRSSITSTTNAAATTVGLALTSITLTAGVWQLVGVASLFRNSATLTGDISMAINTSSASLSGTYSYDFLDAAPSSIVTGESSMCLPRVIVSISSSTQYFLNVSAVYSVGTPQWRGTISAIRIA